MFKKVSHVNTVWLTQELSNSYWYELTPVNTRVIIDAGLPRIRWASQIRHHSRALLLRKKKREFREELHSNWEGPLDRKMERLAELKSINLNVRNRGWRVSRAT